jgi:hypothetical protein
VLQESFLSLLLALFFWALWRALESGVTAWSAAAGAALGLSALAKVTSLPLAVPAWRSLARAWGAYVNGEHRAPSASLPSWPEPRSSCRPGPYAIIEYSGGSRSPTTTAAKRCSAALSRTRSRTGVPSPSTWPHGRRGRRASIPPTRCWTATSTWWRGGGSLPRPGTGSPSSSRGWAASCSPRGTGW